MGAQQEIVYLVERGQPVTLAYGDECYPEEEFYDEYATAEQGGDWSQGNDVYQDGYYLQWVILYCETYNILVVIHQFLW